MSKTTPETDTKATVTADPLAAFKQQIPGIGRKLLGKRYSQINKLASFVVSEDTLNRLTSQMFDRGIGAAGHLHRLTRRGGAQAALERSKADAEARDVLKVNRLLAAVEGGLTGATGVPGAVADLPLLLLLSLRTIYQTADAYGVDLSGEEGRQRIYDVLGSSDLALLGEKQGILLSIGGVSQFISGGGIDEFKQTLSSDQNGEIAQKILSEVGRLLPSISQTLVSRFSMLASGATGMVYNVRIISAVAEAAQAAFAQNVPVALLEQKTSPGLNDLSTGDAAEPVSREQASPERPAEASKSDTPKDSTPNSRTGAPVEVGHGVVAHSDAQQAAAIIESGELDAAKDVPSDHQAGQSLLGGATQMASNVVEKVVEAAVHAQDAVTQRLHDLQATAQKTGAATPTASKTDSAAKPAEKSDQASSGALETAVQELRDQAMTKAAQAKTKVTEAASALGDKVSETVAQVTEQATSLKDKVAETRDQLTSKAAAAAVQLQDQIEDNPAAQSTPGTAVNSKPHKKSAAKPSAEPSTSPVDATQDAQPDQDVDPLLEQFTAQVEADLESVKESDDAQDKKHPRKRIVHVHQNAEGDFEAE